MDRPFSSSAAVSTGVPTATIGLWPLNVAAAPPDLPLAIAIAWLSKPLTVTRPESRSRLASTVSAVALAALPAGAMFWPAVRVWTLSTEVLPVLRTWLRTVLTLSWTVCTAAWTWSRVCDAAEFGATVLTAELIWLTTLLSWLWTVLWMLLTLS